MMWENDKESGLERRTTDSSCNSAESVPNAAQPLRSLSTTLKAAITTTVTWNGRCVFQFIDAKPTKTNSKCSVSNAILQKAAPNRHQMMTDNTIYSLTCHRKETHFEYSKRRNISGAHYSKAAPRCKLHPIFRTDVAKSRCFKNSGHKLLPVPLAAQMGQNSVQRRFIWRSSKAPAHLLPLRPWLGGL